jgi:hypothetical protein
MKTSKTKPQAAQSVDLGAIQTELNNATKRLKAAITLFEKANRELESAREAHDRTRVQLAHAFSTVRGATEVKDLYA